MKVTVWLLAVLCASTLTGQNAPHLRDWKPPAGDKTTRPKATCASLQALTGLELTIVSATLQPASGEVPEFCRIIGQALPEIRFEVSLPTVWNNRLFMFGNGGYAGENLEAGGRVNTRNTMLTRGFVVTQTNTGHDAQREPLGSFAIDSQKLLDYAFRSLHVTAETAKRVAIEYYGASPARSYFLGCSTGGRQALILAQRFPRDFDGIVAGAPVLDFSGTMMQYSVIQQALSRAPIPVSKVDLLASRIYETCDDRDGLKDGLITDPRNCGFQPAKHLPKCAGPEEASCFTQPQIDALTAIYSDVRIGNERVYPGFPISAEVAGPNGRSGWDPWIVASNQQPIEVAFGDTFFRFLAFQQKDPNLSVARVDLAKDFERMAWIRQVLDATNPDLSAFRDRGGKLLLWFGWADAALNAARAVEYYEAAAARTGASTREFFRLFMLPGVFHCGGGVGCATFDPLAPVIRWVERGEAPDRLVTSRVEGGKVLRTRPICVHPAVAQYTGTGSIDDAANFRCAEPSK
jgi:feruloyl esterase